MNELVHLHELDSVRTSPEEIRRGQEALFNAIVHDGNIVVLSFNQLADSQAVLMALADDSAFTSLVDLARRGRILVSQYGNIRTPAQYVLQSFEKNLVVTNDGSNPDYSELPNPFIHSSLPITACAANHNLFELLARSIKYSDPNILGDYLQVNAKVLGIQELDKESLDFIERYVRLILQISVLDTASNPPLPVEVKHPCLTEIIRIVIDGILDERASSIPTDIAIVQDSAALLDDIQQSSATNTTLDLQLRSSWLKEIDSRFSEANHQLREVATLAEAIVDLCYCTTVELSISDVKLSYPTKNEFDRTPLWTDGFGRHFIEELARYWEDANRMGHSFLDTDNTSVSILDTSLLPDWSVAVRLFDGVDNLTAFDHTWFDAEPRKRAQSLDKDSSRQEESWQNIVGQSLRLRKFAAFIYIAALAIVDITVNGLQEVLGFDNHHGWLVGILGSIGFFLLLNLIDVEGKLGLPDFGDALDSLRHAIRDGQILTSHNGDA